VGGRVREGSRDRPENETSGLEPMEEPRIVADGPDSDVEKEPESGDPGGWARMGGLTDPNARKRV
jgi:hypothetical protein